MLGDRVVRVVEHDCGCMEMGLCKLLLNVILLQELVDGCCAAQLVDHELPGYRESVPFRFLDPWFGGTNDVEWHREHVVS